MKVLQVLDYINYNSGVSSVVLNYVSHMDRTKVQCDFLLFDCTNNDCEKKVMEQGSTIYTTMHPTVRNMSAYKKSLDKFFEMHGREYEAIHVHIPVAAGMILSRAKRIGIQKRVLHSHNAKGADGLVKRVRNYILNKNGVRYANCYVACSKVAGNYLFGKRKNFIILPNAIDVEKYRFNEQSRKKIRRELGIGDEFLIGHVGRFVEQKNHMGLIAIFNEVCKNYKDCKLLLIGDGELINQIKELVKQYKVEDKVIFTGVVENVHEYMSAMDIFVLPSLYEGLPVVCVEAQYAGLPCILSDNVTREVALTSNVHFVNNRNCADWRKSISMYMHKTSEYRKGNVGADYDIKVQVKKIEEIYYIKQ